MWPDNDNRPSGGNYPDIPMWAMVPDLEVPTTMPEMGESQDVLEPLEEMKLISDLWATGIPDFDPMPMPAGEPANPDEFAAYQVPVRSAPSKISAMNAIVSLEFILRPPRPSGRGYRKAKLNYNLQTRVEDMLSVLRLFLAHEQWLEASEQVAVAKGRGTYYGKHLRHWIHAFILDPTSLPTNAWGSGNICRLDTEDGLREELRNHLQTIGKYVKAEDVVEYLDRRDTKTRYGATTSISVSTARRWMIKLGYHWADTPSGQYVDGHERDDVVAYRQNVFLPAWFAKEHQLRVWTKENMDKPVSDEPISIPNHQPRNVAWLHDETVFCANDRRERRWVPDTETAVPKPKGEGASLMVADFVSADYGWLRSPDGKESARVAIRPGVNRDGYFTNADILAQVTVAMDIVEKHSLGT
jgi:hypothetical protein